MPLPRARCRGGKHTAVWLFAQPGPRLSLDVDRGSLPSVAEMSLPRVLCRGGRHTAVWLFALPGRGKYLKLTASLSAGRSSRPRPPAHPFLMEEKDAKDHSGGVCGLPLKTPGGSLRSQRYIRYAPRVRVCAGWYALTMPGAAQRCGTTFQRLVCVAPPVRKCLRISERVRAYGPLRDPPW